MTEPVFEEAVYKGYDARAKLVKDTIKAFGDFNMDAVLTVVAECTFDSGYEQKTQVIKTHAEEKIHLFKIKQKQEQQRLFIENYARCIPCKRALEVIKEFVGESWILELNMHRGLWAALLQAIKVPKLDILCRTPTLTKEQEEKLFVKPLVWNVDADSEDQTVPTSAEMYDMLRDSYNCLLIIDPKPGDETNFAYECLCKFTGGKVVYIGFEDESVIFTHLEEKFKLTNDCDIPNWFDDYMYVQCYDRIAE